MPNQSFWSKVFNKNNMLGAAQLGLGVATKDPGSIVSGIKRFMPTKNQIPSPLPGMMPGQVTGEAVGKMLTPSPMTLPPTAGAGVSGTMSNPTMLGGPGARSQMIDMGPAPSQPGFKMPGRPLWAKSPTDQVDMGSIE